MLRSRAIQLNDKELNEESNFPAIVKFLSDQVLNRESDRIRDEVVAEIHSAAEHLLLAVNSELSAFTDPDERERLHRRPGTAQARKPRMPCSRPRCGSRCSTTASPT